MILKTDEIGDYVLVRSLLKEFKRADRYKNYKITFAGNLLFKDLHDSLNSTTEDHDIWINTKRFRRDLYYRFTVLKKIRRSAPSDVINLVYSRSFRIDDQLVCITEAIHKTGMKNDHLQHSSFEGFITPRNIYTSLHDVGEDNKFEAFRNAHFIEKCTGMPVNDISTFITTIDHPQQDLLPSSYFIVFPGSGIKSKKWPASYFSTVALHVVKTYNLIPVICGSEADREDCVKFKEQFDGHIVDLCGKTTLISLLGIMKYARFLISVDTGSVHLAASVGCPVFALFSGLHYGRFAPYPTSIAKNFFPLYPDEIDQKINTATLGDTNKIPIDLLKKIPAVKMITLIDSVLPALTK